MATEEKYEWLLSHFQVIKRTVDSAQALCPGHDDRQASLTITLADDRVLVYCHAGCQTENVLKAAELELKDLFLSESAPVNGKKLATVYPYKDEDGKLLFEVLRYSPKGDFPVRRPDGNGSYFYDMKGIRRVLYRLPELIEAKALGLPLFIAAGEKDVENLQRFVGKLAFCTTNPFGESKGKWLEEYSESVKEFQDVFIFADNDETGKQHAQEVAASITKQPAQRKIRVLDLPGLPGKGDVSDWITAGNTLDELMKLVNEAPLWEKTAEAKDNKRKLEFRTLQDLFDAPEEKVPWLVEGLLPSGGLAQLIAKPKVGKTTLARQLALAVSRGEEFLGRKTDKGLVLYLALEEKASEVKRHFKDMGATGEESIEIFASTAPVEALKDLTVAVKEKKPKLIIIDPLFRFVRVRNGNDYNEVTAAFEPLVALARESGAHVLFVHHGGKGDGRNDGEEGIGSQAIFGSVDSGIFLKKHEERRTIYTRQRYGEDLPESVLAFDKTTRTTTLGLTRQEEDIHKTEKDILEFLGTKKEPVEEAVIQEHVEAGKVRIVKALRKLVEENKVERTGEGKRGNPYLYAVSPEPPKQEKPAEPETKDPTSGATPQDSSFLVPNYIPGTRKPEIGNSENSNKNPQNTGSGDYQKNHSSSRRQTWICTICRQVEFWVREDGNKVCQICHPKAPRASVFVEPKSTKGLLNAASLEQKAQVLVGSEPRV